MSTPARCSLCGEPMPPGEEMFTFHGYSGPCPRPPLSREVAPSLAARIVNDVFAKLSNTEWESAILALLDRERPALGEVDGDALVAELVRRGWGSRLVTTHESGRLFAQPTDESTKRCHEARTLRRILIAPERAG